MLDDKTDIIAHFIGIFELNTNAARMKAQYHEAIAQLAAQNDLGDLLNITINLTSQYGLGGFIPDLKWPLTFVAVPLNNFSLILPSNVDFSAPIFANTFVPTFNGPVLGNGATEDPLFIIPPPAQLATVTVQFNQLEDMDTITTFDGDVVPIDAALFNGGLDFLQSFATQLQPLSTPTPAATEQEMADAGQALSEDVRALKKGDTSGGSDDGSAGPSLLSPTESGTLTQHVAFDADTSGITINGNTADEMPEISALSHRFAAEEVDPEEELSDEELNAPKSAQGEGVDETSLPEDVHEISAGSNVLLNEAFITSSMLDAPVLSVMGQAFDLNVISQVNVWSDVDSINGALHASAEMTQALNAAHFEEVANPVFPPIEEIEIAEGEAPEEEEPGDGPQAAAVVTLDGNFVNYDYLQQLNFANDGDVLSIGFSAQGSMIQTGDNTLVNATSILGLGFSYDLIVVGGDVIDLAFISQTNVLLDSDMVHYAGGFDGALNTSDNLLLNMATIRDVGADQHHVLDPAIDSVGDSIDMAMDDPTFSEVDLLRVLHITGDLLNMQILEQTNVLGDGDQVEFAAQTLQSATGANVSVTTGHNELLNLAVVTDAGLDSDIYTSEGAYTDAFLHQAEFVTDEDPLSLAATDALTGEAFLFLADGLLDQSIEEDTGISAPATTEVAADVMETVLA